MDSYLRLLLEKTMREIKEIVFCVTPFAVTAAVVYLLGAFVCASWDVAMWERADRMFFGIVAVLFGWALMLRLDHGRKYDL
jgi:hypothetical protein